MRAPERDVGSDTSGRACCEITPLAFWNATQHVTVGHVSPTRCSVCTRSAGPSVGCFAGLLVSLVRWWFLRPAFFKSTDEA